MRSDPPASPARIGICILMSDPLLSRRMISLLSGDMHLRLSFDVADNPHPDVILTDQVQLLPGPSIVIDDGTQHLIADSDVRAVLPPNVSAHLLRAAVRIVSAGLMITEADEPPRFADGASSLDRPPATGIALTTRESEVLVRLAHGASNKSIARELGISVHTAKFHVASLLDKLGARNRSDAVAIAISRGLVLL